MECVELHGATVPKVGLGTWRMEGRDCYEAVSTALELGYRHVDTAQNYGNEREVGKAIADADADRGEVFLTTKVDGRNADYDGVVESARESLRRLDTPYVDLMLVHWPNPLVDVEETIAGLEYLRDEGLASHIGVSNYPLRLLKRAREAANGPVLTNQVQFHPFRPQREMLRYCQDEGMLLTAYSPLGHGGVVTDGVVGRVARKYDKTPAQITLRWATQHKNVVTIPKSARRDHLAENLDSVDFKLTREEIDEIRRDSLLRTGASFLRGRLGV